MSQSDYQQERAVAIRAVREAARLTQAVQGSLAADALEKEDRSPVTVADFGSQALVCRALREAFPDDPIIAEEDASALRESANEALLEKVVRRVQAERPDADADAVQKWIDYGDAQAYSKRFWTLDPIDGTKGFLRGDQYAVALALIVEGRPVVAALACPNLAAVEEAPGVKGLILAAVRGEGASSVLTYEEDDAPTGVRTSAAEDPAEARFCESYVSAHSSHDAAGDVARQLGITKGPVRIDSQAKYALVARGDAEIYLRLPRPGAKRYVEKIWDHAAGALVVEEAGGRVTDMEGRPLDFAQGARLENNRGIVATNGPLHDAVIAALEAVEA